VSLQRVICVRRDSCGWSPATGPDSEEARTIAEALGPDVPLLGFFCNGEIYANRLYGYTEVLTVFS
jgi:small ligand-binding sensory domain FIST